MSLSNEAIIAIVALVFTLGPLLDQLWRYYKARQQALAVDRALLDTEMQLVPTRSREPSVSPSSRSSLPIASTAPLHRYPEYRLHEQLNVICVAAYKQFSSRYSDSIHEPQEAVMQTSPGGDAFKPRIGSEDDQVAKLAENETNTFIIE